MIGLDEFIQDLPANLRQQVTLKIHSSTFNKHEIFKKLRNKRLLAFIGSRLRPLIYQTGTFVYKQGEDI
jgi:hypothetical protein